MALNLLQGGRAGLRHYIGWHQTCAQRSESLQGFTQHISATDGHVPKETEIAARNLFRLPWRRGKEEFAAAAQKFPGDLFRLRRQRIASKHHMRAKAIDIG